MKAKLKVLKGKSPGKEFPLPMPRCLVGRGEDCHLRPRCDLVGRQHCLIFAQDERLILRDLQSRNGTFVNGQRVVGNRVIRDGDEIQVGSLMFQILLENDAPRYQPPSPAHEDALGTGDVDEDSISSWLAGDEPSTSEQRASAQDTAVLQLGDTVSPSQRPASSQPPEGAGKKEIADKEDAGNRPAPGKPSAKDSCEAAAMVLQQFFRRS